jgi:hypothetical protein
MALVLGGATVALALLAASPVRAAGGLGQRVAIDSFRGPQSAVMQDAVEGALLRNYFLVPDAQVVAAARKSGVRLRSDEDFAEVGRSLNVAAFVSGTTVKHRKNWRVEVVVRDGETGEAVARYDLTERRLNALAVTLARSTPRKLQVALAGRNTVEPAEEEPQVQTKLRPPVRLRDRPAEETEDADRNSRSEKRARITSERDKDVDKEKARSKDRDRDRDREAAKDDDDDDVRTSSDRPSNRNDDVLPRPYLELGVGGKVFSRSMSFTENFSDIPAYRLDRATAVTIDFALHPFAIIESTRDSWAANLGLTGNVAYAMGITTEQTGTQGRARTEVHGYEVGARYRAALGIIDLAPRLTYVNETFAANLGNVSPDVDYKVMRMGVGIQLALSRQAFMRVSGDYLHVLSAGRLNDPDRFPRAVSRGVDLSLGAGYAFTDSVEAWLGVGLRRYGYDMKSRPGDTLIAGGAIDEYLSMTMGLTYRPSFENRTQGGL